MTAVATGQGRGKVILFGEHAVVYGHPALAAAIDRGVRVTASPAPALALRVPAWSLSIGCDDDHPAARALVRLTDALGCGRPALSLEGEATLPPAAGLGSSAALAVAIARALVAATHSTSDPIAAANAAEAEFHRQPSGVDVALAAAGGIGVFRSGQGLSPITAPPFALAIGLSGDARSTATMIDRVRAATGGRADDPRLVALGAHATGGATELSIGALAAVGARMDEAHALLADLGVSSPALDVLVSTARAAGALGAKLTGAGGGGAVIALAPGSEDAVLAGWRAAGFDGFVAQLA